MHERVDHPRRAVRADPPAPLIDEVIEPLLPGPSPRPVSFAPTDWLSTRGTTGGEIDAYSRRCTNECYFLFFIFIFFNASVMGYKGYRDEDVQKHVTRTNE